MKLWRRKRTKETTSEAAKSAQQRVDRQIVKTLADPKSLGVWFPCSHRGEWIPRTNDE